MTSKQLRRFLQLPPMQVGGDYIPDVFQAIDVNVTVQDESGNPIQGATVVHTEEESWDPIPDEPPVEVSSKITGSTGKVTFKAESGDHQVYVKTLPPTGDPSTMYMIDGEGSFTNPKDFDVSLTATSSRNYNIKVKKVDLKQITVTFLDAMGNPVPNMPVTMIGTGATAKYGQQPLGLTDASGTVKSRYLSPGSKWQITPSPPSGLSIPTNYSAIYTAGDTKTVKLSGQLPTGTSTGPGNTVKATVNVRDANGNAIPGAAVSIPGATPSPTLPTDATGKAIFYVPKSTNFTINITATGYKPATRSGKIGADQNIDFNLQKATGPAAPELGDINISILDQLGNGVPGVPVALLGTNKTSTTNSSGKVQFKDLPENQPYDINVTTSSLQNLTSIPSSVSAPGDYVVRMNVSQPPPKGKIKIVVRDMKTKNPIQGAKFKYNGNTLTTNASGKAESGEMEYTKSFNAVLSKKGYDDRTYPGVGPRGTEQAFWLVKSPIDFEFSVKDQAKNAPAKGVLINVIGYPSATTDATGKAVTKVDPYTMRYNVIINDPRYEPFDRAITFPQQTSDYEKFTAGISLSPRAKPDIDLPETLYLSQGYILDSTQPGKPINITGAMAVIKGGGDQGGDRVVAIAGTPGSRSGQITPTGSFIAKYEKKGTFPVEFRVNGYKWKSFNLNFSEKPGTPIKIELTPMGSTEPGATKVEVPKFGCLLGKVTDQGGDPVIGASISANGLTAISDIQGNYKIPKAKTGKNIVIVSKTGYKPYQTTINIKPTAAANGSPGLDLPGGTGASGSGGGMPQGNGPSTQGFGNFSTIAVGGAPAQFGSGMTATASSRSFAGTGLATGRDPQQGTRQEAGRTTLQPQCNRLNIKLEEIAPDQPEEPELPEEPEIPDQNGYEPPPYYYQPPPQETQPSDIDVTVGAPSVDVPITITQPSPETPVKEQPTTPLPSLPDPVEFLLAPFRAFQQAMTEARPPTPPR